jgi:arylsulfatase A-like enzyme
LLLGVLVAILGACHSRPAGQGSFVATRILTTRYQTGDDPSTAAIPVAPVGGVYRPVLAASPVTTLLRMVVPADERGSRTLDVPIPERLRAGPIRLTTLMSPVALPTPLRGGAIVVQGAPLAGLLEGPGPRVPVADQTPRVVAAPAAAEAVQVTLDGSAPEGDLLLVVSGRAAPERSYTTGPITVPRGGRLRFGIGVDDPHWLPAFTPVTFTLRAFGHGTDRTLFSATLDPGRQPADRAWSDHEIDLSRNAGDVFRLRFQTTGGEGTGVFSFPVWSDPEIVVPTGTRPAAERRRNVLLISLDTLRADRLGCYGYGRPTSPTIDGELAARGTLFKRAYTAYPSTTAAHLTLLTSLDPCVHRVTSVFDPPLRADALTLAEQLRAAGYETAAFTENVLITAASGFARGFDTFVADGRGFVADSEGTGARQTFDRAREWIGAHRDNAWFVFVHTYQVHNPYTPPPGYLERVGADAKAADTTQPTNWSDLYDGEIRYTDDVLAGFLRALDALGQSDETLVVLTADHGEHFGEHGRWAHNNSLYEELLHVPLIFRAPGLVAPGKQVREVVGLVDVVPTVLELLGLPPPRWAQGTSLRPFLLGERPQPPIRFAELGSPAAAIATHLDKVKWIIDTRTGRGQLFDLRRDPREAVDLAPAARVADSLLKRFRDHCASAPPPVAPVFLSEPDAAAVERLRALGYVN